jgi:cysteinyl-tRNA synthetase
MITKMLDDSYAYISGGNVYFDISKAKDYYKLSGMDKDLMMVGVRDSVEGDDRKRNPGDFVLWFTISKFENHIMKWDSPWGVGYPGWHIECSGIASKYLGEYLDIHCGGVDNIFPHHTNEIAQSEAYFGHKWCNYWCHGEHLNDNRGKMSKSSGEFLTVSLLEEKGYNPIVYRYFCLKSHYRKQLVFSYDSLDSATTEYNKLIGRIKNIKTNDSDINNDDYNHYNGLFKEALENDLNTSSALTVLFDVLKSDISDSTKIKLISDFDKVLSLDLIPQEKKIDNDLKEYITNKIKERSEAKKDKNYELADKIRDELKEKGIIIKDGREGTTYEII